MRRGATPGPRRCATTRRAAAPPTTSRSSLSFVDGLLLLDKPAGPTSQDAVSIAKRALSAAKAGHAGTLDPFATGLLLVCLGRATKLAGWLAGEDKRYRATVALGVATATDDREGKALGVGGHLASLRRTESGLYKVEEGSVTLDTLKRDPKAAPVVPVERIRLPMPDLPLGPDESAGVLHGRVPEPRSGLAAGPVRL